MSGFWHAPRTSSLRRISSGVMIGLASATLGVLGFTSAGSLAANGYGGYGYGYGCPGYGYGYCPPTTPPSVPSRLTLSPVTDTNPVGTSHTVTATVRDQSADPMSGVVVRFTVTGAASASGSCTTISSGQCTFTYPGPTTPGTDAINAFADSNNNGSRQTGEPQAAPVAKTWVPGDPATLVLTPDPDTNVVDEQHCVTATVKDAFANPTPNITVRFSVTGSVTTSGQATTNSAGQAQFCYTGPPLPGADVIAAYADTDKDNVNDPPPADPEDTANKAWVIPPNMVGCKVTYGGRITAANGDKATFGGNAKGDGPKGNENYQDHGPATDMHVKSIRVQSVVCNTAGTQASIFGTASIDGSGTFNFRIDLKDLGEPGSSDTYRIRLSNGYDSGEQVLKGGNVQIH